MKDSSAALLKFTIFIDLSGTFCEQYFTPHQSSCWSSDIKLRLHSFSSLLSRYFKQINTNIYIYIYKMEQHFETINQSRWVKYSIYKLFQALGIYCGYYKYGHTNFQKDKVSSRSKLGHAAYPESLGGVRIWVGLNALQSPVGPGGGEHRSRDGYSWGHAAANHTLCCWIFLVRPHSNLILMPGHGSLNH